MIKHIGQLSGYFYPNANLFRKIELQENMKIKSITKIGIQLEPTQIISLNNKKFKIGSIRRLGFTNTDITAITVSHSDSSNYNPIFVILDYEYIIE